MSHLLDAPAGKHGFVRAENGHFVNDAGRVWFNATNLTGSANFPTHDQADLLAERLSRFGFNAVRLHYMDANYGNFKEEQEQGIFTSDSTTQRNLDPEQIDKMDYMIAQFKKRGIYVNLNLHVARKLDDRDGFTGIDQRPPLDKGVDNFVPRMISLQKEYAKDLLTHVNPYTGLAYTDEPSIAMVEINNENALFNQYLNGAIDKLPDPYRTELEKQWNKWLHNNYNSIGELVQSWGVDINNVTENYKTSTIPVIRRDSAYSPAVGDFFKFIYQVEQDYWTGLYDYLKKDLEVKALVSGTQLRYTSPFIQSDLDYVDIHAYWSHPSPVSPDWEIGNISMVNSMNNIHEMAVQRVDSKPFTISEYNHPFPNQYGAEAQPMLAAYGRLQGWDGIFQYTYNHRLDFEPQAMTYFFDMIARTDVIAHMPACAAMFLRGDVHEAIESITAEISHEVYFDSLSMSKKVRVGIDAAGFDPRLSLIKKTAVILKNGPVDKPVNGLESIENQKVITSSTGEIVWNGEKENAAYLTVNTPNTKLFTGFPEGRTIELGGVTLDIGTTRLGWATISFVSKNASGFGESGESTNILLTATGLVENKGMVIKEVSETKIKLTDWGEGPIQAEGIPATINLPSDSQKTKCYALDSRGDRMMEVPVFENGSGSKILLKPEYQTVWYEIEIQ
ncbi:beta-galactosidase [uncultured Algoriphagus sp.]|uniref:beta-galactosidase n=1 Tax=uncultured Algoriphagus sp. TaxID=417365 RepID=UPI0030ECF25B|tara:strand:- start:10047 stop:12068 length:2022 start_codon:yes stop_codon:yes gene_type:complete